MMQTLGRNDGHKFNQAFRILWTVSSMIRWAPGNETWTDVKENRR